MTRLPSAIAGATAVTSPSSGYSSGQTTPSTPTSRSRTAALAALPVGCGRPSPRMRCNTSIARPAAKTSAGASRDNGPGTDFHAVANGKVSVSPLLIDLTATSDLDATRQWLKR